MSGETEENVSGWTTDTILAHLNVLLGERDRRYAEAIQSLRDEVKTRDDYLERLAHERAAQVKIAFDAAQTASAKADAAYEKRFEGQNEFRAQLSDQAATFMPRKEYDAAHAALVDKVNDMNLRMGQDIASATGGRTQKDDSRATIAFAISAVLAVLTVVGFALAIFANSGG